MYIERTAKAFGSHIELIEDLQYLLKSDGFTVDLFGLVNETIGSGDPQRGKQLIIQRDGTTFWSFNATFYSRVNDLSDFTIEPDTANSIILGNFTVNINNGYTQGLDSANQPKYGISRNAICAALNKEGRATYRIYSTPDSWDWLITTEFDGYTFFTAFGNKSKGLTYQGNYALGSYRVGGESNFLSVPIDLDNTNDNDSSRIYPKNPFFNYSTLSNPFIFYYDTFDGSFVSTQSPILKGNINPGSDRFHYEESMIKGFFNDYSGVNSMGKASYFCKGFDLGNNIIKTFYDFDIGFINIFSFENGEIRTINGKRYKFHHLCKRIDNQSFDATVNKGNCGFWIRLGDKRV